MGRGPPAWAECCCLFWEGGHTLRTGQAAKRSASVRRGLGASQEGRLCCETRLDWALL